jgi:hypothetical protein
MRVFTQARKSTQARKTNESLSKTNESLSKDVLPEHSEGFRV